MKKNLVPLFGIAFVVAIVATGVFYGLFANRLREAATVTPPRTIVVAARNVERGALVQESDLKLEQMPAAKVPPGAFAEVKHAVGLPALETTLAGQPLLESKLASHRAVPPGMRAISVHVADSSGVVAMLHPGYKVDVQVVGNGGPGNETALRTVLQNIEVLHVSPPELGRPVVNLLVTPGEADLLGLADSTAKIRLLLRNPEDGLKGATGQLPFSQLMQRGGGQNSRPMVNRVLTAPAAGGGESAQ